LAILLKQHLCFEDVTIRFTDEEWAFLDPDQRALHQDVMEETRGILTGLTAQNVLHLGRIFLNIQESCFFVLSDFRFLLRHGRRNVCIFRWFILLNIQ
uniref:KRAB domain-containing protein n=1 Tax=Podarcis muralis TaxID=64176 RepID=A0A670HVI3_PODMU